MDLQYWNNGTPVLPVTGLGELKYWLNGMPYFIGFGGGVDETSTNFLMFF